MHQMDCPAMYNYEALEEWDETGSKVPGSIMNT